MNSLIFAPLRSERFVVTIRVANSRYKVLQVGLYDRQGGIYVALPYFKHAQGIAGQYTVPATAGLSANIDLRRGGRTTSQRVKYAHHVDGEAHFSQDGKVITAVRKKSVPLSEANGHLFTVQLQGIEDFKRSVPRDDLEPSAKRTVIEFGFVDSSPRAVKIVGYWYTGQQLLRNNPGPRTTPVCGPRVTSETPLGKQTNGFLLAPAHGTPAADQVLLLTCEEVPQLTPEQRSLLLFVGGFDTREAVMNSSEDTTALFLLYENRASSFEELTQLLGSIDWPGSQVRLARE